jgi:hypothetical protein
LTTDGEKEKAIFKEAGFCCPIWLVKATKSRLQKVQIHSDTEIEGRSDQADSEPRGRVVKVKL